MDRIRSLWESKERRNKFTFAFIFGAIFAVILRYCFYDAQDPSKCGALLTEGSWLDEPTPFSTAPPKQWQPPGCMIHSYTPTDVKNCLSSRRVVFAGDSTIRQVFWATAKKLDPTIETKGEKHTDITVERDGVKLQFYWDPFLNETAAVTDLKRLESGVEQAPAVMLLGTGLWYARYEDSNKFKKWRDSVDNVVEHMRTGRKSTDLTHSDFAVLAPVPVPSWEMLNEERKKTITVDTIEKMNAYLQELLDIHGVDVVSSWNRMTTGFPVTYQPGGIHVQEAIAAKQADTLLNLRCNAVLQDKYPYDRTCCNKYHPPNWQQWWLLIVVLLVLPILQYLRSKAESEGTKVPTYLPSESTISALVIFGFSLVFCFYADRTQVFNKLHKNYTNLSFISLTLLTFLLGYFTLTKSSVTVTDQPLLFRDQTDEWKGWMQALILIYHYTGASKVPWIYGFIRITVASYLFMTGFGHTIFFLKKADYSFKRVAGVLIRLNLLSLSLPYIMKTDYLFYYFAPLVTWWFIIIYSTLRLGAKYNVNTRFLIGKIIFSALFTTAITRIPGILEFFFSISATLFHTSWNVIEWRFRVFLDMWIVYIGMLFAIVFIKLSDQNSPYHHLISEHRTKSLQASGFLLLCFFIFQTSRPTKLAYNAWHPYISWIPIVCFILLRNATPTLRNTYSSAFAWLGKCSLETFTLQFHIWLAADTKGLLDYGIFGSGRLGWALNLAISTTMFLYTSECVSAATGVLTGWIMGTPPRRPAQQQPQQQQMELPTVRPDGQGQGLTAAQAEEVAAAEEYGDDAVRRLREQANRRPQKMTQDGEGKFGLKARVGVVMGVLWVLNLTYTG